MWNALIKLIEKWSCMHDWDVYAERTITGPGESRYFMHTFICKKCGKFNRREV